MAKAAILMPYAELRAIAETMVTQFPRITPICIEYVQTAQVHDRVQQLEKQGCDLIVARGLQARIARDAVVTPVVEMRASTQELEALVLDLKKKLPGSISRPRLGIIGFFNMFHGTQGFNELLDIDLKVYTATDISQYGQLVDQAARDGCLGLIGGDLVRRQAEKLGLKFCFLSMGEESMREALEAASMLGYSIDLLKHSNAEMSAMLDNTFTAIMQADSTGTVRRANRTFFQLMGRKPDQIIGERAVSLIGGLSEEDMESVIRDGREIDARMIEIGQTSVLMNITPVLMDSRTDSIIFTFQEGKRISAMDSTLRQELARRGYLAKYSFRDLFSDNPDFSAVIAQAKRLSRQNAPVLLSGESGAGKGIFAQCIHNESLQRGGAFITLDCSIRHPDDLDELLFGRFGSHREGDLSLVEQARGGTLYLRQIEVLTVETQYKLKLLAQGQFLHNGQNLPVPVDVKLIVSTESDLKEMTERGAFRKDLYYVLNAMRLEIPPLRRRREDIPAWLDAILTDWCGRYKRQVRLSRDAEIYLAGYDWPGNLDQINSLCQRLVLLSEKRTVDEATVRAHLNVITSGNPDPEPAADYHDPRAEELMELLNRFHGNREKAAAELGISKTTLWRRMKKYGIARDLSME